MSTPLSTPKSTSPAVETPASSLSSEPPSKRQKMTSQKQLLSELPPHEFSKRIDLFDGPKVTLIVEGRKFHLPKALLCYSSAYFERAFNGGFKEGQTQEMTVTGCSISTFELVIQFLYTSRVTLPTTTECLVGLVESIEVGEGSELSTPTPGLQSTNFVGTRTSKDKLKAALAGRTTVIERESHAITIRVAFLRYADEISLVGAFSAMIADIKEIIINKPSALKLEHIRDAFNLPSGHTLRELFVQACTAEYLKGPLAKNMFICTAKNHGFRFYELMGIDSFAAEVFREYTKALRGKEVQEIKGHITSTVADPLKEGSKIIILSFKK